MKNKEFIEQIKSRKGNRVHNGMRWPFYELESIGNNFSYTLGPKEDVEKVRVNLAVLANYHNKKRDDNLRIVVRKEAMCDEQYNPIYHDVPGKLKRMYRFHVILVDKIHHKYTKKKVINENDSDI